eukprot:248405_1
MKGWLSYALSLSRAVATISGSITFRQRSCIELSVMSWLAEEASHLPSPHRVDSFILICNHLTTYLPSYQDSQRLSVSSSLGWSETAPVEIPSSVKYHHHSQP